MTSSEPGQRAAWPADGLESIGHCPVCGDASRTLLHSRIADRLFGAPGTWTMHRCDGCGSAYLDPRPDAESVGLAYANYETHRPAIDTQAPGGTSLGTRLRNGYLNTKYGYRLRPASRLGHLALHLLPPPYRLEWDHYARHLRAPQAGLDRLLDIGCGNGEFLLRARMQGWSIHGLDFDAQALAHAREAGVPVTHGTVQPHLFPESSFAAITSHQVIEHVHDLDTFVQSLKRWLVPCGTLWLGTPNIESSAHKRFGADWVSLQPPAHLQLFSPRAIIRLLESNGFDDVRLVPRGFFETYSYRVSARLSRRVDLKGYQALMQPHPTDKGGLSMLARELRAWLRPGTSADMVVLARRSP